MVLAIVGPEERKFTPEGQTRARQIIRDLLVREAPQWVISGACPAGGIDIWAIEEAKRLRINFVEFPPKANEWSKGYRPRNIELATRCTKLVCIVPASRGRCKHCHTGHVSNGGCWTMNYARQLGRQTELIVFNEQEDN